MTAFTKGLHEVADGVYAYLQPDGSWGWSNAGLVADGDASLLVDTLFDLRLTAEMLDTMRGAVPAAEHIGTVVNTHANGDHCYGNQLVAGAAIVASRACAEEMPHTPPSVLAGMLDAAPKLGAMGDYITNIFGAFEFHDIELTLPTQTFDGELTVKVGDREVQLIEVGPAHTRGDVLVHLPDAGVVFTGDILFIGGHPIMWAGPVANWIAALDRIVDMSASVIVPGHGPVTDRDGVLELRGYFAYLRDESKKRFDAGMTPLDAARDIPLQDYAQWGEGERVVANIASLYREFDPGAKGPDVTSLFADMAALAQTKT